ncbi:MAG: hypothetical protein LH618_16225 [Saprospiraceae bacterium]|nr:hypothetical protein [Saprospiraceae bacterium]
MPDKKKDIKVALDDLDNQVISLVGNFVKRRKAHYEKAAQMLHQNLKKDTQRYAGMLSDKKISREDFEFLLQGRAAQMKIELLAELSMSKAKFDDIAMAVLKLTANTVFENI